MLERRSRRNRDAVIACLFMSAELARCMNSTAAAAANLDVAVDDAVKDNNYILGRYVGCPDVTLDAEAESHDVTLSACDQR